MPGETFWFSPLTLCEVNILTRKKEKLLEWKNLSIFMLVFLY